MNANAAFCAIKNCIMPSNTNHGLHETRKNIVRSKIENLLSRIITFGSACSTRYGERRSRQAAVVGAASVFNVILAERTQPKPEWIQRLACGTGLHSP
jgi:hypothetical protein